MSVTIQAVGVCAPLGRSLEALWEAVASGRDGFIEVERFDLDGVATRWASAFDAARIAALCAEADQEDPALAFAVLAGRDAIAGLSDSARATTGLVLATSAGAADTHDAYDRARKASSPRRAALMERGAFTSMPRVIAQAIGIGGPRTGLSTACASGGHALGVAIDALRSGDLTHALVIGSDSVHPSLFAGFHSVGALAPTPCSPFGERFGMSLGEGAGALLLRLGDSDEDDPGLGSLIGWGASCDAYHATAPDPQGRGMARALDDALSDAGIRAEQVGAFNAHGTGTEANDAAEGFAVRAILGESVPVSASKSQLGHTQGAAGVLEALVSLAGLRHQALPPSLRADPPRRLSPADTVREGRARPASYDRTVSHSAAFGGTNVAVVLSRRGQRGAAWPQRRVYASGVGVAGLDVGSSGCSLGVRLDEAFVPVDSTVVGGSRALRTRRADPISRLLTEAVGASLVSAGLDGRDVDRGRIAMVAGMADGPQDSIRRFVDSRDRRGLGGASAAAFARMVFNAPAGVAAAAAQIQGPNLTLWTGVGAGAQAVRAGARMLQGRDSVDAVLACAADELGHITEDRLELGLVEGRALAAGACVSLSQTPGPTELVGMGWGTADDVEIVIETALGERPPDRFILHSDARPPRLPAGLPDPIWLDERVGHAAATGSLLGCIAAIEWVDAGHADRVLVVSLASTGDVLALVWAAAAD